MPCEPCGQAHDVYHACRNRSGPTCHRLETEAWLAERRQELLPVPSLHVVLTLPQERHALVLRHQPTWSDILLRAAAPHDVGGLIGVLWVRHPWTRPLPSYPHGHGLVSAGGVSADRTAWWPARQAYLVPVQALSQLLRGLFLGLVRQERPALTLSESVWTNGGVVYCKPAVQGTAQVLNDLGRDVRRLALTNHRLLSLADGQVRFRSQDTQDQCWTTMTLPAHAFIRRVLPPVLPQGFHTVRYDGLWSPVHRPLLHQLQRWLARDTIPAPCMSPDQPSQLPDSAYPPLQAGQLCPHCGQGLLVVIRLFPRLQRGPP